MEVLGLKDPFSKERLMQREQSMEKTLQAARIERGAVLRIIIISGLIINYVVVFLLLPVIG